MSSIIDTIYLNLILKSLSSQGLLNITYYKWQLLCQMKLLPLLSLTCSNLTWLLAPSLPLRMLQGRKTASPPARMRAQTRLPSLPRVLMERAQATKVRVALRAARLPPKSATCSRLTASNNKLSCSLEPLLLILSSTPQATS